MPRKHKSGKRKPTKDAAASVEKVRAIAFDMEEPLNDALDFVVALRLIGNGLIANHDDDGRAIFTIAWAASERIAVLKEKWEGIFKAATGRPGRKAR